MGVLFQKGNMSWQAYADQITSQGIAPEIAKILSHMSSNGTGRFTYGGRDFITLRNDGSVLYGKLGVDGITCAKSGKALVVGVYDKNSQPGQCNNAVEFLASYSTDNGY